jgi:hypothetical protein
LVLKNLGFMLWDLLKKLSLKYNYYAAVSIYCFNIIS